MVMINIEDFKSIRNQFKDKKIVFCSGNFDLTHAGHILFFEDCKKKGDILVVGIGGDKILKINKGNKRPILNERIRAKTVDSLKPVDYCFIDNISNKENNLLILDVVFENLKPDVYVINNDTFNISYRQDVARKFNVNLIILKRWCPQDFEAAISTTHIIEKIRDL